MIDVPYPAAAAARTIPLRHIHRVSLAAMVEVCTIPLEKPANIVLVSWPESDGLQISFSSLIATTGRMTV